MSSDAHKHGIHKDQKKVTRKSSKQHSQKQKQKKQRQKQKTLVMTRDS